MNGQLSFLETVGIFAIALSIVGAILFVIFKGVDLCFFFSDMREEVKAIYKKTGASKWD